MTVQETVRVRIGGMHCQACANRVVRALQALPGVSEVTVDLGAGEASLSLTAPVAEAVLAQAVSEAGYEFGGLIA